MDSGNKKSNRNIPIMIKVSILGHFGFGHSCLDGQTVKTCIIADEMEKITGKKDLRRYDTHGGLKFLCRLPFVILMMLFTSRNIIILPAQNGIRIIPRLLVLANRLFNRKIHYIVIGGWLPELLSQNAGLKKTLCELEGIHVETESMKSRLNALGLSNIHIMPNTKYLSKVAITELPTFSTHPYPLCTFSRVIPEKGIEDAIKAVVKCNETLGYQAYTLDIYGQIGNEEWFENLKKQFPQGFTYKGMVPYDKSVEILKSYYALLFPTYYEGECFAGTFLDAFAAGLPVIASDWHDNASIVKDNHTGWIVPVHSVDALVSCLKEIAVKDISQIRRNCVEQYTQYDPSVVVGNFISNSLK